VHIYDEKIAWHYAAYRPALHQAIVDEVFISQAFATGLDIGCGTGRSTRALTDKCRTVFGVDSSRRMLDKAAEHPRITYLFGSAHDLPIADASIDVVTFAGVLSYLDMEAVTGELKRVCRNDALICPYDFEIILEDLLRAFGLPDSNSEDAYDHACNLSDQAGLSTLKVVSRVVDLTVTGPQAAHLLLSEKNRYDRLCELLGVPDPFGPVVDRLDHMNWPGGLEGTIYYALHQLEN